MTRSDIEMFADSNPNPEEWKQFCMELIESEWKNQRVIAYNYVLAKVENNPEDWQDIIEAEIKALKETTDERDAL